MGKEKKKLSQTQTATPKLITPQQIIKIEALQQAIQEHIKNINRPYSMIASAVIFPSLLMFLFLDPRSPLHPLYMQYYEDQFALRSLEIEPQFADQKMAMDVITEASNLIHSSFQEIYQQMLPLLKLFIDKQHVSFSDMLNYIDANPDTIPQQGINDIKRLILKVLHTMVGGQRDYTDNELAKIELAKIYPAIEKTAGLKTAAPKLISLLQNFVTKKCVQLDFRNLMVWPKVITMVLGQWFIIDPLLARYFPNGIGQSKIPRPIVPANIKLLSQNPANELLNGLQQTKQTLGKSAWWYMQFSRALLPIIFGLCIAYQDTEITPQLWFFLMGAVASAFPKIVDESKRQWQKMDYKYNISRVQKLCTTLFHNYTSDNVLIDEGNMEASQFNIRFKGITLGNEIEPLSVRMVCSNVVNVLLSYGVKINHIYTNAIVLPAAQLKSFSHRAPQIKQDIETALTRQFHVRTLKAQLNDLKQRYNNITVVTETEIEQRFLRRLDITLQINAELKDSVLNAFSHFQPAPQVTDAENGNVIINLCGHQPLDKEQLEKLEKVIKEFQKKEQKSDASPQFRQPMEAPEKHLNKSKLASKQSKEEESISKTKPQATKKPETKTKIQWPSGTYDPNSENNIIVPIKGRNDKHYALLKFGENDCPQSSYSKFLSLIKEKPQFVGPRGEQGLKKASEYVRNNKGENVPGSFKAKPKKFFGNPRAVAYEEKAPTGEVLHVFEPQNICFTGMGH